MTHYTINYEGRTPIDKHNSAIQDIKDWLGEERFDKLVKAIKADPQYSFEQFQLIVSFAGVQGYPVKALYNYCYGL